MWDVLPRPEQELDPFQSCVLNYLWNSTWKLTPVISQSHHSWKICLFTQENYINLPGLLFSCKYKVTVHLLKSKRRSKDESTTFFTPSCATIRSKTHKHIPCPGEGGKDSSVWHMKGILKSIHISRHTVIRYLCVLWYQHDGGENLCRVERTSQHIKHFLGK